MTGSGTRPVPWWAVASAGTAPVLLIGGWTLSQALQPAGYDPVCDTISALAAHGAADRWVMTSALAGLGVCHVLTALGLHPARPAGRMMLGVGGVATVAVAAFAQPAAGNSVAHTVAATAAFAALALWPAVAADATPATPLLSRTASTVATVVLVGLVLGFAGQLHGGHRGLAERAAAGAQSLWPLAVVIGARRARRR